MERGVPASLHPTKKEWKAEGDIFGGRGGREGSGRRKEEGGNLGKGGGGGEVE